MNMAMQQLAAFSNHGSRSKTPSENSECFIHWIFVYLITIQIPGPSGLIQ